MNFIKEKSRIYYKNEEGKIVAEITYKEVEKGLFNIEHTFVDESLRGQGIASKLVDEAIKKIKNKDGKIMATCSYAKKWLEKNKNV